MFNQLITLLAWLALPARLIAIVDDWFLRPARRARQPASAPGLSYQRVLRHPGVSPRIEMSLPSRPVPSRRVRRDGRRRRAGRHGGRAAPPYSRWCCPMNGRRPRPDPVAETPPAPWVHWCMETCFCCVPSLSGLCACRVFAVCGLCAVRVRSAPSRARERAANTLKDIRSLVAGSASLAPCQDSARPFGPS